MSRTPPPQAIAPHRGIGKLGYDGNMRGIAAVFLVGCTFSGRAEPVGHDALGDSAILSAPCTISVPTGTLGPASLGESASGMNGNPQTPPQCPTGQLPIGAGFDSTANPVFEGGNGGERVVTAVAIQCGTISRDTTGAFTATAGALVGYQANPGGCVIWGPITTAPIVSCPTGSVLVGFTANDGGSSLFNTVALACAQLTAEGEVGTPIPPIAVVDTGNYTNKPASASCPAVQAVVGYSTRGNCGVDQLTPLCAPLTCALNQ